MTAVTPVDAPDDADVGSGGARRTYSVDLHPGWTIGGRPNGGYLLAVLGRASRASLAAAGRDHPDPLAAAASYLRAPNVGPATVVTEITRVGRTASQVRAFLLQDGKVQVDASFVMGALDPDAQPTWSDAAPVALPARETLDRFSGSANGLHISLAVMERVDLRLDPRSTGALGAEPSGIPEIAGWVAFADGHPADPLALLYFADSLPPASLELGSSGWVPTIQLTVYVRGVPAPGPLRIQQRLRVLSGGLFDEVCDVWDADDRLVAQGVQLAQARFLDR